jgi:hypothetical protein
MEHLVESELAGENEVIEEKPAPVPLRPTQIPHELT